MKKKFILAVLLLPAVLFSQKAIFLHHSTGNGVWTGGVTE